MAAKTVKADLPTTRRQLKMVINDTVNDKSGTVEFMTWQHGKQRTFRVFGARIYRGHLEVHTYEGWKIAFPNDINITPRNSTRKGSGHDVD